MKPNIFLRAVLVITAVSALVALATLPLSRRFYRELWTKTFQASSPSPTSSVTAPILKIGISTKFLPQYTSTLSGADLLDPRKVIKEAKYAQNLLQLYLDPFSEWLDKDAKLTNVIKIDTATQLVKDLKDGSLNLLLMHGFEYVEAKKTDPEISWKPLAILAKEVERDDIDKQNFDLKALLITNKSQGVKKFSELRGTTERPTILAVVEGDNAWYKDIFLRDLLDKEERGIPREKYFSSVLRSPSSDDALDDIVDKRANAALITESARRSFDRRKPVHAAKLDILAEKTFPPIVLLTKDRVLDKDTLTKLENALINDCEPTESDKTWGYKRSQLGRSTMLFWRNQCFLPSSAPSSLP